ncbi:NAD(P)H-dependent flavin oxidoreductase [Pelagibius sp.]|uniref:NAD(P)H-dependent flavin oxidoreductase n=1 Tax=Pelagibius sp. TaxID=1931238 RepID=UPI003BB0ABA2
MGNRFTERFGVSHPIVQAGMSWASSNVALPAAVSNAGGLGVLAAGPMFVDDFREALRGLKSETSAPFAVNVPLYRPQADEILDIVLEENAPILIASQGGPGKYLKRIQSASVKCIHVVASERHAKKAMEAGVDGLIVVGAEAGGHPPPAQVSTFVLVRAVALAAPDVPLIAGGGIVDGAGIVAALALGADAVQLGTRYLATRESRVHEAYKQAVLHAGVEDTTLVGKAFGPIRMLKNTFSERYLEAEAAGADQEVLLSIFKESSLKLAALDGDPDNGKPEAGQSAGLIKDLPSAEELTGRLIDEYSLALARLSELSVSLKGGL